MLRLAGQRQEDIPFLTNRQVSAAQDGTLAVEAGIRREAIVMGGFVGGMIAGAVVVLLLGAVLSLNTPLTRKPIVAEDAPEPAPVESVSSDSEVEESVSDAGLVKVPPKEAEPAEEQADTLAGLDEAETATDTQPQVKDTATQVEQAAQPSEAQDVTVSTEAPIAPQAPAPLPDTPLEETGPEVAEQSPEPPAPVVEEAEVEEIPQDQSDEVADAETLDQDETLPQDNPIAVEGEEEVAPPELPRIASVPQIGGEQTDVSSISVGKRIVPLTERDDAPIAESADGTAVVAGKPIEAYSAEFENPDAKPLMSIILIDDEGAFGAEALQDFPYPISFAISPADPDAAEKMAKHRAAGFEVLAMADLPKAASAQDAEVSLSVWLDMLPETVGILEGVETGIQGNRKLADQVAAIAGGTGRGLITQDNGLNTVQKLAARNGIPSGVIFRDIDGARQDPKIMRRFLDQAAFRAGQEGTVVMLGRLRPDTISALLLWGLEDRGGRVAMAPISAVMMQEVQ